MEKWRPEAIQKAAYSKAPARKVVAEMADGLGRGASGKRSHAEALHSKAVCAQAVLAGQARGLKRLREQSIHEQPFRFWITSNMYDETKLWYMLKGKGFRRFSTFLGHGLVTWADGTGIHDEDIVRPPKALRRYSAAAQWQALEEDKAAGVFPRPEEAPRAKYYGSICEQDSHAVNILCCKHLRVQLPNNHLMLPSFCKQHHVGRAATAAAERLHLFTPVWCLAKTFAEGDFHQDLESRIGEVLEDEDVGLEVVDPATFVPGAEDLGADFTGAILDRCLPRDSEGAGDDGLGPGVEQLRVELFQFFPLGWNRERALHPCPAGCCGPSPCHDRAVSVTKARRLVDRGILRRITQPAKNKWTKMEVAF